ncbi:MAG TPA: flagellar basal body protein [Planctomycetaceae bacterium]
MSPTGPSSYELLRQLAVFGERRQQVLAENVANIDTPNYKTRDLDTEGFRAALRAAVLSATSPGQASVDGTTSFTPDLFAPRPVEPPNLTFQDGNNRSIEREVTELTKNLLMQNFAVELMAAQTQLLSAVIAERP